MNDNINWNNIRIIDHTQEDGFEELVCQIARKEKPEDGKRFIQLGIKEIMVKLLVGKQNILLTI